VRLYRATFSVAAWSSASSTTIAITVISFKGDFACNQGADL
jgi:hypothetical protein